MVMVAQRGRYSVYIYAESGGQHHLPHCHVRWSDGTAAVELLTLTLLEGSLPPAARDLLYDHRRDLVFVWNMLNPERPIR